MLTEDRDTGAGRPERDGAPATTRFDARRFNTGIPLPGTRWRIWPQAMVRSAGFPAATALGLSDPAVAEAADALDGVSLGGRPDLTAFEPAWQEYWRGADRVLAEVAGSDLFRLAVTWQNRSVLASGVDPLLRQIAEGGRRDAKRRSRDGALATYLQRYCLKNETIGFFGPIAWAGIDPGSPAAVTVRPGPGLVSGADVHLEGWAVDALAARLSQRFDLRPWLAPRRAPLLRLRADGVELPSGKLKPADPVALAVLARADGRTPAGAIAEQVARAHRLDPAQVTAVLADLVRRRWLHWDLELAGPTHTERELGELAERVTDPAVREAMRTDLRQLGQAVERVQQAWDDLARLGPALGALDETFVMLTGSDATRRHGQAYSGRTVAYLESRRDVAVELGGPFLDGLAVLAPLADSARWLSWRVRELFLPQVRAAHQRLLAKGTTEPNAMALWLECLPLLAVALPRALDTARREFHEKWRRVLPAPAGARLLHLTSAELSAGVAKEFAAPRAGWSEARLCCPDMMMIGGAGPDEPLLVLGELHLSINTMDYQATVAQHPDVRSLTTLLDQDFPEPRLLMALPKDSRPRLTPRSHPALVRERDYRLVVNANNPIPTAGTALAACDVDVREEDGELWLTTPGGDRFDVMDLFGEALKEPVSQAFGLLPGARRPRIVVDRMVVARESWTLPARKAAFATLADERERFVVARHWARRHGIPRFVFVKSPLETKPFFVDFDAPPYVEALARTIRRLGRETGTGDGELAFTVTEMLPGPEHCWLTDAEQRHYTAELRLVMVDTETETGPEAATDDWRTRT
ncbi:lantibiotic dehydratase [Kitasatospora viridis]|uniref:Lantibiotic biosynthesis dehydratase-like protein n=1 Tax=Kitasatospora viridis TaxID=281105 RepID=A0A561TSS8_9ACTN|nr:lantibiotic dehydratase [Kitasatospora viridis]TWF90174.1 lantibiotic biosynthesis dehydratase-like protein [Kitasatospora viridis]